MQILRKFHMQTNQKSIRIMIYIALFSGILKREIQHIVK